MDVKGFVSGFGDAETQKGLCKVWYWGDSMAELLGRGQDCECVVYVNLPSGFQKFINSNAVFFSVRR